MYQNEIQFDELSTKLSKLNIKSKSIVKTNIRSIFLKKKKNFDTDTKDCKEANYGL